MTFLFVLLFATQQKISDRIVVTASDVPETIESTPAAVTVVTKKDIDERAARDVADVLREVPGLAVSRTGSPGKATSLFTRGAVSTQTLVLWNGIEINNPYFSGYDWGRFSTAGVEQVEVVRGPFSALYGSEAVAGVVNVITEPTSSGVRAEVASGGHGLRNAILDGSWVGGANRFSAALEHRTDDGFAPNDDFRQNSGNALWRWAPSKTFSLGVAARATSYDLGVPFNLNATGSALVPSLQRRQNGTERQIAVPLQQTLGIFSYDVTLAEARNDDRFDDPDDPFGVVSARTTSRTRRARLTTRTATSSFGTIVAGGEIERAKVDDVNNFGVNLAGLTRRDNSLFVEDRAKLGPVELSAGVRYDRFDTFGSQTSPRVAAAFVHNGTKWRAAYGEGFRAPSIGELYYPFSGNVNLKAERSRSFEAGLDTGLGRDTLLSLTAFWSRYRNLINFDNATFAFANIGRARSDGLELGVDEQLPSSFYSHLAYTFLHRDEDEATGERLPRRPKHSGALTFGWRDRGMDANLSIVRSGARADILPVVPFSRVTNGAYTTVDANVQIHAGRLTPFVKLENLRGARYEEVLGYPSPGRRAILGLRFGM
ncbi:MAG TPA: TonB-dependent receptor [Thermoanaerobaculia bacterium]|nr:TonB-dependent receptor [Thermoanaerobaculia bacterium]